MQRGHIDPVCGMGVDETNAVAKIEHEGQVYRFCSVHCERLFRTDPLKYARPTPEQTDKA